MALTIYVRVRRRKMFLFLCSWCCFFSLLHAWMNWMCGNFITHLCIRVAYIATRHAWTIYNKFFEWKFIIWPLLLLLVLYMDVCCSSRLSFLCCVMIANLNHFIPQEILCHYCWTCVFVFIHTSFSLFVPSYVMTK